MPDTLLDQSAVSMRLKVAVRTLERWRTVGFGPRWVKVGRAVRYREDDVETWLASCERQSTSEAAA
jgi:predicted DNA-binding transcriptional regulator AlpA